MDPQQYPTSGDIAAVTALGTTASPLLAGFSITLIGLVVGNSTPASSLAWPNLSLLLLTLAIVLFIVSVQFTVLAKKFALTQKEHEERTPGLDAGVRKRGFDGAMKAFLSHSKRAQLAFIVGLGLLLLGLATMLYPTEPSCLRRIASAVALVAFIGEAIWAIRTFLEDRAFRAGLEVDGGDEPNQPDRDEAQSEQD